MNAITRFILNPYSVYSNRNANAEQEKAKKARVARKKARNHRKNHR